MLKLIRNHHAETEGTQPFFMYLALQCAHAPNQPDKYASFFPPSAGYTKDYADYNGMISAIDDVVGNLTSELKSNGWWANTLMVRACLRGRAGERAFLICTCRRFAKKRCSLRTMAVPARSQSLAAPRTTGHW